MSTNGFLVAYQGICKLCQQEHVFAYIHAPEY